MAAIEADDLPHLHRFVTGLRRDYDAVRNALTLPHSSGAVEGNVNRIKMIKRQMYGRYIQPAPQANPAHRLTTRARPDHEKWARSKIRLPLTGVGRPRSSQALASVACVA
jgi:hypothetical protein